MTDWQFPSVVEPKFKTTQDSLDEDMMAQCLLVSESECPRRNCWKVPKTPSIRDFSGIPCRKPVALTYHACAELVTKSGLVGPLHDVERSQLLRNIVPLPASLARGRKCGMCPDRIGCSRVLPGCLCENCRAGLSPSPEKMAFS